MSTRTGQEIKCQSCGISFYASGWQLKNKNEKRRPKFCSRKCKYKAFESKRMPWAKPEETIRHSAGYLLAWEPAHPRSSRGRVLEHILVAEKKLGRYLHDDEQVHHRDRDKANNDPDNLLVLTSSEHARLHAAESPVQSTRVEIECWECGVRFKVKRYQANPDNPQSLKKYCSMKCRSKSWGRQMAAIRKNRRVWE